MATRRNQSLQILTIVTLTTDALLKRNTGLIKLKTKNKSKIEPLMI